MQIRVLLLLVALTGSLDVISQAAETSGETQHEQTNDNVVTGTLEELDLTRLKGRIKTDLGKPIFFEVSKPQLFERITVGQHVTVQLDKEGRAIKVIDVPVPELKQP